MQIKPVLLQHHAHIWISDQITLQQEIEQQLKAIFCKKNSCNTCITCQQIQQRQHPWIQWLTPEGQYTLDDIDQVLEQVKFKLDSNEYRFFIFTKAEELTAACSNRLLKTIEEPHERYIFIFLATRSDTLLPTIISRCFVKEIQTQNIDETYQELLMFFMNQNFGNALQYMKVIDKLDINHQTSKDFIDALLLHFYQKIKHLHDQPQHDINQMQQVINRIIILKNQLAQLPVQGSSKIFLKNLFLTFHQAH